MLKNSVKLIEFINKMGVDTKLLHLDSKSIKRALDLEGELAYMVPSGKYWESSVEFDRSKLSEIDSLWLKSASKLN